MNHAKTQLPTLLAGLLLALVTSAGWANDGRNYVRFQATLQASALVTPAPPGVTPDGCKVGGEIAVAKLVAVGAATTNLFGPGFDHQSHCVRPDFSFYGGHFKLTNPKGDVVVVGRYFGKFLPTVAPPQGKPPTFLIDGNVCIVRLRGYRVDTDCDQSTQFAPATGITDLNTGAATIFIDQWVRVKQTQ